MEIEFVPPKLEIKYYDFRKMKKEYGEQIAEGMMKFLQAVRAADSAYDLKAMPQFFIEHKKGNLKEYYAASLDKKKSKWRLMIQMLDLYNNVVVPDEDEKKFLQGIKKIRIMEMSNHYDEY